jgi:hypothetical protein
MEDYTRPDILATYSVEELVEEAAACTHLLDNYLTDLKGIL